jgi:pyrimidine-nucleoside phosphorylase
VNPSDLIAASRDGRAIPEAALRDFVAGIADGRIPDYQAAAWLMACYIRGLTPEETLVLALAMRDSGKVLEWPSDPRPLADKHSTGGVGDKISLILGPLAAALGLRVPMISGRSLGHTGGTLDKLESIPGLRTRLDTADFQRIVDTVGVAMCGQTDDLAPADRVLYSLRDATSTVDSIPLICASILSKKLAENPDGIVFDVKQGRGAFMRSPGDAGELASALVTAARGAGKKARALITGMDFPLGLAAGNSLEVLESMEVLRGRGPEDVRELTLELASAMLGESSPEGRVPDDAMAICALALDDGSALTRFERMVEAQGGDLEAFLSLPRAPVRLDVSAPRSGLWSGVDALELGQAIRGLGAGRYYVEDRIDHSAGWEQFVAGGSEVNARQAIGCVHAADEPAASAASLRIVEAFVWDAPAGPRIRGVL